MHTCLYYLYGLHVLGLSLFDNLFNDKTNKSNVFAFVHYIQFELLRAMLDVMSHHWLECG